MSFKKEFDKIMEDLIGEEVSEPEFLGDDWCEPKNDYEHYKKKFYDRHFVDSLGEVRRKADELFRKYRIDTDFIDYFCEKHIHKCNCNREFVIYSFVSPKDRERSKVDFRYAHQRVEIHDVLREYKYRTYYCPYCGRPFDVVNGQILRIQLKPEDIESTIRRVQH